MDGNWAWNFPTRAEQMRREDSDNSSVPDIPIPDGIVAGNDTLAMGLLASS